MAEAWRIHNKCHSNPVERNSDSELLILASSLFNGMESIEVGGGSEVQGNLVSNRTVFGGGSEVKAS
jgi:hypothetical protein